MFSITKTLVQNQKFEYYKLKSTTKLYAPSHEVRRIHVLVIPLSQRLNPFATRNFALCNVSCIFYFSRLVWL